MPTPGAAVFNGNMFNGTGYPVMVMEKIDVKEPVVVPCTRVVLRMVSTCFNVAAKKANPHKVFKEKKVIL